MIEVQFHTNSSQGFALRANLTFSTDQVIAVSGQSGAGKSTFLKALVNLTPIEGGVTPPLTNCAFVFQDFGLFPSMTAKENILFNASDLDHAMALIEACHLNDYQNHLPSELSIGQQQRVAIARSLAQNPDFLLLDEPFSAQDQENKKQLQQLLLNWRKEVGATIVIVSHNPKDLLEMATQLLIVKDGDVRSSNNIVEDLGFKKGINTVEGEIIEVGESVIKILIGQSIISKTIEDNNQYKVGDTISLDVSS